MRRLHPLDAIRLYTLLAGLASTAFTVLAVPELSGPRAPGRDWQIFYAAGALLTLALAQVWMGRPLRRLGARPTADPEHRRLAHDFPVELVRGGFGGALAFGLVTAVWMLARGGPAGDAVAVGAITYVVALWPVLGLYLGARHILRRHAAGPPGAGPVRGIRQPLAGRLALALQVPVVICAVGLLLVQEGNSEAYAVEAGAYFTERLERMARAVEEQLPGELERAEFAAALPPSVTARLNGERPDELRLGLLPYGLLAGLILLAAVTGRRLARTVTDDLASIGETLRHINDDDPSPPPPPAVALRETTAVARALDATLAGLTAQRSALRRAAAERRRADAAKARFLAHLSHELKSPLNSILGFSEVLLAEIDGPIDARQRSQLGTLWRSGDGLLRFILALLDLSRLEGLRSPGAASVRSTGFAPAPTTAADLARMLRQQVRPDPLEQVDIRVALYAAAGETQPVARFDPAHTARALYIAAGSLIDAMDRGEVQIAFTHPRGGGVEARIEVVSAEGEPSDRAAVVQQWRAADTDARRARPGPGDLRGAPVLLLHRLVEIQGGGLTIERFEPWPVVTMTLPAA